MDSEKGVWRSDLWQRYLPTLILALVCNPAFLASAVLSAPGSDACCAPSVERVSSSRPAVVPVDADGQPINLKYTPLMLPVAASVHGIELSGQARLYEQGQNHYYMASGCALLHTTAPTRVDTAKVAIYSKPDASMVVHSKDDATVVMNISDRHRASVRVVLGKSYVDLSPGQEMAVADGGAKDPKEVVTGDILGYRNLKIVEVGPGVKVALWEFSLDDAIKQCYIFRQLKQSPDEGDHKLLSEIVKTAAAVDTMYKKTREAYTYGPKDSKKPDSAGKLADRPDGGAEK